jgi:hypothetical protein
VTRKDIIRMAREVSNTPLDHHATPDLFGVSQIERFFKLAYEAGAKDEREACAQMVDHILREGGGTYGDAIRARGQPDPKVTHLNEWARDRLARHGIQLPDEDEEYGNPSF